MSDTAKRERMVRELVDRAARNHTVFVECSPEMLKKDVFSQPLHVMLQTAEDGAHMLVFKESDEIVRLRRENATLRAAVERARALHTPISYPEGDFPNDKWCAHCEMIHGSVYWGDNDPTRWPCPTLRALEGTP